MAAMAIASAMFRHVACLGAMKAMAEWHGVRSHRQDAKLQHCMTSGEDSLDDGWFGGEADRVRRGPFASVRASVKLSVKAIC